ncbi:ABC transporter permease [Chitinophaga alhagiae]|uniref:ABC transporter permease n=1 Tax=Chitinophaga alhagiae TaxID=2203219 RepID=UPI001E5141C9|nr:ABC transporter permease [Chitinophaga alhagiae]
MNEQQQHHPPSWAQRFVEWYCKPGLVEDLTGDLHECFERNLQSVGPRRAKLIYIIDAFKFFRSYTVRRSIFVNLFMDRTMLGSYVKTSGRNIMRSKLFSFINILGLAISMSVGLLLIAFVLDLRSYDRFHENGGRTYRVTNVLTSGNEQNGKFATTSIKTGQLIREKVPGIDAVAIMRNNFSGDAKVGDNILPVSGYWAEPSLFRIFTFPMIEGHPETALKDPYSVVLTETAARKLFGSQAAVGKAIRIDTLLYQVTGIMQDVPFFSHIQFEALVSLSTAEQINKNDPHFAAWTNMWSNSVYVLPSENADMDAIRSQLGALAREENLAGENSSIRLELLPLYNIVVGESLRQSEGGPGFSGPHMPPVVLWILGGLAFIVILSACFNYTNLSIARAMRRMKEIGLRKAIGAGNNQVRLQFLAEAVMISLAALLLSFLLFLLLRPVLINMAPEMQRMVKLSLTPSMVAAFIVFSVAVGVMAGFLPAIFFSKVSPVNAFSSTSVKMFKHLTLRRALVLVQYTVTLIFITTTAVGYVQYRNILAFDLGFSTANILNINMQANKPDALLKELGEMPEVTALSRSLITTGVGNAWGGNMKYKDSRDSQLVMTNHVDENYLPLHNYQLVAGSNFIARPATARAVSEVIVNQQVLKRFNIGGNDPQKAIGEQITLNGRQMTIVGVMQDFHYGKVEHLIGPVAFTFWTPEDRAIISARIQSANLPATLARIGAAWKKTDPVHPLMAEFYDEAIENAYSEFSTMIKIIGFLSFLAISIASMGLFGMVVFTTETRLKEIGIRKVMGASVGNLMYLLSRGFLFLLSVSAFIALPATYFFFKTVVLPHFPYHTPVQFTELFAGLLAVLLIAFMMIGSQTLKAASSNPVAVLRSE